MRASELLGRARGTERRGDADTPAFPYYSKSIDGAGRFLQSNLIDAPQEYVRGVYAEAGGIAADAGSRMLSVAIKAMAVAAPRPSHPSVQPQAPGERA